MKARPLCKFFEVGDRFRRSVNIAADYDDPRALDDYIVTPLGRTVLTRVFGGLRGNSGERGWSITGPYGAGKSACALFMARLLGYPHDDHARQLLVEEDPELLADLCECVGDSPDTGYAVVPLVGSYEPISCTILGGLIHTLSNQPILAPELGEHLERLRNLYHDGKAGEMVSAASIAEAVEHSAEVVHSSTPSILGLFIVYDELGRSLEYAALHPEHSDVGILQTLAELASRSQKPRIGLVTILHQAFEHYAATLGLMQQREWAKVQGRFQDIGFLESPGQLLGVIAQAIQPTGSVGSLAQVIASEVDQAAALDILPKDLGLQNAKEVLAGCAPLHPTVTLVLGRLSRSRLAQNERSLFAFLSSGEPYGFQEYLGQHTWSDNSDRPFYRIDKLYDYVVTAMGSLLHSQGQGKRWAEIEDALDRLPKDSGELEARLVKAIGLLGLLGDQRYLKASHQVLSYAVADGQSVDAESVRTALQHLEYWGICVYRRFKDAYGLWHGSDIDLDERFRQGLAQIDRSLSLASLLQERNQVKPFVVKRHLHETGTFRYFVPWLVDLQDMEEVGHRAWGTADGAVAFILGASGTPIEEVTAKVKQFSAHLESTRKEVVFFAVPEETRGIREACEEALAWEWVAQNTPELEGDSVARRELAARQLAAQGRLDRVCVRCFTVALGYRSCRWIWAGEDLQLRSARALWAAFSNACDRAYADTPIVQNELINRRALSSAAAAARRALIECMLTHPAERHLELTGYPPEMSIYLSVLERSGLHHLEQDRWAFGPPQGEDPCCVLPMWHAIDRFLATTEKGKRDVTELYDVLRQPPFGMKDGLLPIYLAAAMLHWQAEIALYEEGSFVPELRPAEFERLLRVPERFSLQRYGLDTARARMLHEYSTLFGREVDPSQVSAVTAVRPLMAFAAQLPRYTMLTESLSDEAIAVRKALLTAREPQPLLFETLPQALGFDRGEGDPDWVVEYFARFRRVLVELQSAYGRLLGTIQRELLDALRLPFEIGIARREIAQRAGILQDWVSDLRLKAFVLRLSDEKLPDREWLESVASCVANKPPSKWNDGDKVSYRVALAQLAGQLKRTEEIALEKADVAVAGRVIRLGVTDDSGHEQREVLHVAPEEESKVQTAIDALEQTLSALQLDERIGLTALAEVARRLLGRQPVRRERDDE